MEKKVWGECLVYGEIGMYDTMIYFFRKSKFV